MKAKQLPAVALILYSATGVALAETSAVCRGVAAGVVAGMRADGALPDQKSVEAAVKAARQACEAGRSTGGAAEDASTAAASRAAAASAYTDSDDELDEAELSDKQRAKKKILDEDISLWDVLMGDRELTDGNKRLRRLRNSGN
ncbi:MAG: hypothetical protein AAF384_07835 [Pseudomonadota bacterium]